MSDVDGKSGHEEIAKFTHGVLLVIHALSKFDSVGKRLKSSEIRAGRFAVEFSDGTKFGKMVSVRGGRESVGTKFVEDGSSRGVTDEMTAGVTTKELGKSGFFWESDQTRAKAAAENSSCQ